MTFWIITQKTTFCTNKLEETFYNVVMGFVYCFCYINLRDGNTRYRLLMFYTLMVAQNFGSLFLYVLIEDMDGQRKVWSIVATISVVVGTVLGMLIAIITNFFLKKFQRGFFWTMSRAFFSYSGMCGMILYYRWFHEKGPIIWRKVQEDIELNNKVPIKKNENKDSSGSCHARSFKSQTDQIGLKSKK